MTMVDEFLHHTTPLTEQPLDNAACVAACGDSNPECEGLVKKAWSMCYFSIILYKSK